MFIPTRDTVLDKLMMAIINLMDILNLKQWEFCIRLL